jgi:hypothetical protein
LKLRSQTFEVLVEMGGGYDCIIKTIKTMLQHPIKEMQPAVVQATTKLSQSAAVFRAAGVVEQSTDLDSVQRRVVAAALQAFPTLSLSPISSICKKHKFVVKIFRSFFRFILPFRFCPLQSNLTSRV